ncbi:ABC transporter ATP-binding protein [Staphylococcus sp. SQ8-PEA]|uniref:ABC transporter ATP-binding protein n=1 Tax=Staphylococcus marylandisciuri TaxID=2981529 RepID=A0ABT2QPX6_9STAP|nr:ABC transporter ATP-binding protein [Staphylococcus marylandisciuri]MCU5746031.1 ABC transporter ATP-binding protein [Staphylococcus marylandisciuri]
MIRVKGLEKSFRSHQVIKGVSLDIPQHQCTALIGTNGAGKSTLINLIIGHLKPDAGNILDVNNVLAKGKIGVMFQKTSYPPLIKVKELFHLYRQIFKTHVSLKEFKNITCFNKETLDQNVKQLSGGQQRILDFALTAMGQPPLIIMDEPTSSMDVNMREHFWECIEALKRKGTTIFYTSHYIEEVERVADNVVLLERGKVRFQQSPEEVKQLQPSSEIRLPLRYSNLVANLEQVVNIKLAQVISITTDRVEEVLLQLRERKVDLNDIEIRKTSLLETLTNSEEEVK